SAHDPLSYLPVEHTMEDWEAAAQAGDAVTAHRAAAAFHSTVVELADNTHLQELWGTIQSRVRWMLSQHDDLLVVTQEHRGLFEALASRDEELLERLVVEHAQTSRDQHRERQARRS
ncbi:FCD domain-containing protein, partial [Actinocorallia glomerata]|uniref:FCD domain-containing protein n=1 Tax=Actinocorallia glomerata TaxID=46203 RepID=UPI0031E41B30